MKKTLLLVVPLFALMMLENGCVVTPVGVPPVPLVEVYGEPPFPGAVWVGGNWFWHGGHRSWDWHPGHWRH